jgi:hypothetical protein
VLEATIAAVEEAIALGVEDAKTAASGGEIGAAASIITVWVLVEVKPVGSVAT